MSLWVDKYRPKRLEDLDFHNDLTNKLSSLASTDEFPHMLIYGPSGAGKKTRVIATLKALFGPAVEKIKIESKMLQVTASRKVEFNIASSIYHMEITPSDMGNYDRVVIQELLKEVAQTKQIDVNAKKKFKVVILNEADSLSRDAQSALRRTMEKYSPNLRLIMLANTTSKVMPPIRSRTLLIRVPAPSTEEITEVLTNTAKKEKVSVEGDILEKIAKFADGNLRVALLAMEAMYSQNEKLTANSEIPVTDWSKIISKTAEDIYKVHSVKQIATVRANLYQLLSHCIPADVILKNLLFNLLDKVNDESGAALIQAAAMFDHRLKKGNKPIFHLEAFVARAMQILESR